MARSLIKKAEILFTKKKYDEVITLLEPQIIEYRESDRFYFILGSACLWVGDMDGAGTYLRCAEKLKPYDIAIKLSLAALDLKNGRTDLAIERYLWIIENKQGNRKARKALDAIRSIAGKNKISAFISSGKIYKLYPRLRIFQPKFLLIIILFLLLSTASIVAPKVVDAMRSAFLARANRPEVAAITLNDIERVSPLDKIGTKIRYVLSESSLLDSFEKAKTAFQSYKDNEALIEINRILHSNAIPGIKEKARILKSFQSIPDFLTLKSSPLYRSVQEDPILYDSTTVAWKGVATNIQTRGRETYFDFLVGYENKKRLFGTARAIAVDNKIQEGQALELLARIRVTASGNPPFILQVYAVKELTEQ